jgi:glycosyltransferase involved in cell wall biosynthesis
LEVIDSGDSPSVCGTVAVMVRDSIKTPMITSLLHSNFKYFAPRGVHRIFIQGSILTIQRNEAIQRMKGDWILFVDDDMVFETDDIARLVAKRDELDLDVIGGLCFRRTHPHQPTLYRRSGPDSYVHLEKWEDGELLKVDATGCAFLLLTVRALEKIVGGPMPPFEDRAKGPPPNFFRWEGLKGEDIRFCEDLVAAGCDIYIDTSIKIGHIAEKIITEKDFFRSMAERPPELEKYVKTLYGKHSQPILTAREAKKKLYG